MAADMVGYSRLVAADEIGTITRHKAHRRKLIEPKIASHDGRIVKTTGDGFLVEFQSAAGAVECATEIQKAVAAHESSEPEARRISYRIGINVGDIVVDEGDVFGDGVNVAARLEQLADPGGLCISDAVFQSVKSKLPVEFENLGLRAVKNVPDKVHVYRLRSENDVSRAPSAMQPLKGSTLPDRPSIAILPFDNLSGDPEQQYFGDGIAEDVITDLSKVSGLFVIARNSAFTYRGKSIKAQDVCRELGVRYVLEGSVRKSGDRVRITAQLIDGSTGGHLWAERYDRSLTDIFVVQDEVTREIVSTLAVRLTPEEWRRLDQRDPENLEAYDHFVRGRQQTFGETREANVEASGLLTRAIELDPQLTRAYSMLSHVYLLRYVNGWTEQPEAALQQANELSRQAVALDNSDLEAHWNLGLVHLWLRQHDLAIAEEQYVVRIGPSFAPAYAALGSVFHYSGRSTEAIEPLLMAMRLDPRFGSIWLHFLAQAYFGASRYEEAAAVLKRRIIRQPDTDISRVLLASCYGYLERPTEARVLWQEALHHNPNYSLDQKRRALPYKNPGDFDHLVNGLRKAGLLA
ncbi:MAG: adenylate/guanylate cyclase domain-containing protein [Propylenella sp.]